MKTLIAQGLFLMVAAATLGACASTTPMLDARFGDAVRTARIQQMINADAGSNPDPVTGLDGRAAAEAIVRYHDSFKAPPSTFPVLQIGGGIAGDK